LNINLHGDNKKHDEQRCLTDASDDQVDTRDDKDDATVDGR